MNKKHIILTFIALIGFIGSPYLLNHESIENKKVAESVKRHMKSPINYNRLAYLQQYVDNRPKLANCNVKMQICWEKREISAKKCAFNGLKCLKADAISKGLLK